MALDALDLGSRLDSRLKSPIFARDATPTLIWPSRSGSMRWCRGMPVPLLGLKSPRFEVACSQRNMVVFSPNSSRISGVGFFSLRGYLEYHERWTSC